MRKQNAKSKKRRNRCKRQTRREKGGGLERQTSFSAEIQFDKCDLNNGTCIECNLLTGKIQSLKILGEKYDIAKEQDDTKQGASGLITKYVHFWSMYDFLKKKNNSSYAVKTFFNDNSKEGDSWFEEVVTLSILTPEEYPAVLVPAYPVKAGNCQCIIMHYKDESIHEFYNTQDKTPPNSRYIIFIQILDCLISLLDSKLFYGDLRPKNILIHKNEKNEYEIFMADIGCITPFGIEYEQKIDTYIINEKKSAPERMKKILTEYVNNTESSEERMKANIMGSSFLYPSAYKENPEIFFSIKSHPLNYLLNYFHQITILFLYLCSNLCQIKNKKMVVNDKNIPGSMKKWFYVRQKQENAEYKKYKEITEKLTEPSEDHIKIEDELIKMVKTDLAEIKNSIQLGDFEKTFK